MPSPEKEEAEGKGKDLVPRVSQDMLKKWQGKDFESHQLALSYWVVPKAGRDSLLQETDVVDAMVDLAEFKKIPLDLMPKENYIVDQVIERKRLGKGVRVFELKKGVATRPSCPAAVGNQLLWRMLVCRFLWQVCRDQSSKQLLRAPSSKWCAARVSKLPSGCGDPAALEDAGVPVLVAGVQGPVVEAIAEGPLVQVVRSSRLLERRRSDPAEKANKNCRGDGH